MIRYFERFMAIRIAVDQTNVEDGSLAIDSRKEFGDLGAPEVIFLSDTRPWMIFVKEGQISILEGQKILVCVTVD